MVIDHRAYIKLVVRYPPSLINAPQTVDTVSKYHPKQTYDPKQYTLFRIPMTNSNNTRVNFFEIQINLNKKLLSYATGSANSLRNCYSEEFELQPVYSD